MIASPLQFTDDPVLVLSAECLHGDLQFYCRVAVCTYELVVIQTNYISLLLCNDGSHIYQFTRLIRKKHRYRENSVSLDRDNMAKTSYGTSRAITKLPSATTAATTWKMVRT